MPASVRFFSPLYLLPIEHLQACSTENGLRKNTSKISHIETFGLFSTASSPLYKNYGISTMIWSPLASGLLTGKVRNGTLRTDPHL